MFFFSLIQDGPRGLEFLSQAVNEEGEEEDVAQLGIDWPIMESRRFMTHWADNNLVEAQGPNAFSDPPPQLSHVPCDPPNCPFNADEVSSLNAHLRISYDLRSSNMEVRRMVWIAALDFSSRMYNTNYQ